MKKYLDIDKETKIIYNNIWLDEHNLALKIPISDIEENNDALKLECFDLSRYNFLLSYR